ncbi:MAG: alanine--tRNA ligase [Candidatus Iainarchaeum archaeon]|uniref:Alanine--tRNA ligase n=1 Tax=Candidatus Iainarchaeum sp. TaxID=3101447 RepID=A0A7T9DIS0_9ARCH|nr:MAG: alanine--tRNA ligase [Candidatus Diapherotrites archaeon]
MVDKTALRAKFTAEWEHHYKLDVLTSKGFSRHQCKTCGRHFWSLDANRTHCADSSCMGYEFIGKKTKDLSYVETWRGISKYFTQDSAVKHTEIKRFPVVSRWRDDLYFTNASIIDFQPYVVTGEVEPPANPLIVPQHCLRFNDVGNVGITGRHYTGFVMFGQHAFNTPKTGLFYWKNEALENDYQYLTKVIGVKPEDLTFQEDVWAGGGTFGPSIEYTANGMELGNCVFMQYQEMDDGTSRELSTKVIDMGAGLERLAWYTNGTPTSYEVTFGDVIRNMKRKTGVHLDEELFTRYAKLGGLVNMEDDDVKEKRDWVAQQLGMKADDLYGRLGSLHAMYAIADHLKTILYTTTDGMLPSNAGGGYNLRLLLRRVFGFNSEYAFNFDYGKILEDHAKMLKGFDDSLQEGLQTAIDVVLEDEKKFMQLQETGKKKMQVVVERLKKENKPLQKQELVTLYESHGIPYELAVDAAKKGGVHVEEVFNFYDAIGVSNEKKKEKAVKAYPGIEKLPATKTLYYDLLYADEFSAKVLAVDGNNVILDQTLFYPEGGGQSYDTGTLNGVGVKSVQKIQNRILHEVENPAAFHAGMEVKGFISRERRANLMHNHTATHVLNATCREVLGNHVWQAGAHKEWDKAHLDITHYKKLTEEEVRKIEAKVNLRAQQTIPVHKFVMDRGKAEQQFGFRIYQGGFVPGKELRIVQIEGVDVQACGGTHINNTGEIGFFKILKTESVQDGIERLTYATGVPALEWVHEKEDKLQQLTDVTRVPEQDIVQGVQKLQEEYKALRKKVEELQEFYLTSMGKELVGKAKGSKIVEIVKGLSQQDTLKLAQLLVNANEALAVVLVSRDANFVVAMSGKMSSYNAKNAIQTMLSFVKGSGGGSEKVGQAKLQSLDGIDVALMKI